MDRFNIKEWHDLSEGTANYLGMRRRQDEHGNALGTGEYIGNLEDMDTKPVNGDWPLLATSLFPAERGLQSAHTGVTDVSQRIPSCRIPVSLMS